MTSQYNKELTTLCYTVVTFYIFQITFLQIGLKISMSCSITCVCVCVCVCVCLFYVCSVLSVNFLLCSMGHVASNKTDDDDDDVLASVKPGFHYRVDGPS